VHLRQSVLDKCNGFLHFSKHFSMLVPVLLNQVIDREVAKKLLQGK
jgi:hypothetical protein